MKKFDPNLPGAANGNYFALPFTQQEAEIVLVSVPWDVTTSYRAGTHRGPGAIIDASEQIDLYNSRVPEAWNIPIGTIQVHEELPVLNRSARLLAEKIIPVSYTHLRAHETVLDLVCRLLLEKKKKSKKTKDKPKTLLTTSIHIKKHIYTTNNTL